MDRQRAQGPVRSHRRITRRQAATSPVALGAPGFLHVRGGVVCDVGCGSGLYGFLLRTAWHQTGAWLDDGLDRPERLVGVDFSPICVARAREHAIYDEVLLSPSWQLPLADRSVDTSVSVECLEHLDPVEVPRALGELARIARRRVVVTSPAPQRVVNVPWLEQELREARGDPVPVDEDELRLLAGHVHRSALFPEQLARAGFQLERDVRADSHVYWADVSAIRLEELGPVVGIEPGASTGTPAERYMDLLQRGLRLQAAISWELDRLDRRSTWASTVPGDRRELA